MNTLKIQQDVLKALCKGERVFYYHTDDGVFLATSGSHGWIVPDDQLRINLVGAQVFTNIELDLLFREENKLIGTDEYRKGGVARRYRPTSAPASSVYVNIGLLKYFDAPTLYQEYEKGPIAVVEQPIDGEPRVVGMVMPVIVKDDDDWKN